MVVVMGMFGKERVVSSVSAGVSSSGGGGQALVVLEGLDVGVMDEALAGRVREVLAGVLNGMDLDEAAGKAGFEESGFLALALANESVMDGLSRAVRALGVRSALKVQGLAVQLADSPVNVSGKKAAIQAHQWFATNALPELMTRAAQGDERRRRIEVGAAKAREAESRVKVDTGVEE